MELQLHFDVHRQIGDEQGLKPLTHHMDVIIIGAGPAGFSAGIYAKRKGLATMMITESAGGQLNDTSSVENYPGFVNITGESLARDFHQHALSLQIPIQVNKRVNRLEVDANRRLVHLDGGEVLSARAVIIATGSTHKKLGVMGEDRLSGRGVAYCAICDGPLFKGKEVIVAGGGNAAVEAAIDLSKIAGKVILVHRSQLRADKILVDQMEKLDNVETYLETRIVEIMGDGQVTGVKTRNSVTENEKIIKADGVFVEIGYTPNTSSFKNLLDVNEIGEILTDKKMQTSVSGIFAAGDVAEGPFKQIVIAAGDGAKAALSANEYINQLPKEEEAINETA